MPRLNRQIMLSRGVCPERRRQQQNKSPQGVQTLMVVMTNDPAETDEADEMMELMNPHRLAMMERWR